MPLRCADIPAMVFSPRVALRLVEHRILPQQIHALGDRLPAILLPEQRCLALRLGVVLEEGGEDDYTPRVDAALGPLRSDTTGASR